MKPKNYPFFFSLLIVSSSLLLAQEDSDLNTNNNYNNHSNIPISQSQETLDPSLMMIRNGKTLEKVVKQPLHQVFNSDMKSASERMQAKAQTIINLQIK